MARTARTKQLTAIQVKRFAESSNTPTSLHDGGGLYLRKRSSKCNWYLRLTDPLTQTQQWHLMFVDDPQGHYPHKSLQQARDEADRLWAIRSSGIDPRAQRKQNIQLRKEQEESEALRLQRRISVEQLFQRWRETELQPHLLADGSRCGRKDGGEYVFRQFKKRVFPAIGSMAAEDVTKADLMPILDSCKAQGKLRTANVLLATLKQMFRFALVREVVQRNPLDTVSKRDAGGRESSRARVLNLGEIEQLSKQLPLSGLSTKAQAAIWIVLSTGCRIGELMKARWEDLDLHMRTWYLPETKNGRSHTIHLSSFATDQFELLLPLREELSNGKSSPWLFTNSLGTGPIDVKTVGKQIADRQKDPANRLGGRTHSTNALCLPGGKWTAHDLRRTSATLMAQLGVSSDVIDECLLTVNEN